GRSIRVARHSHAAVQERMERPGPESPSVTKTRNGDSHEPPARTSFRARPLSRRVVKSVSAWPPPWFAMGGGEIHAMSLDVKWACFLPVFDGTVQRYGWADRTRGR